MNRCPADFNRVVNEKRLIKMLRSFEVKHSLNDDYSGGNAICFKWKTKDTER